MHTSDNIIDEVEALLAHQNLWRKIMSVCYFLSTALAIVSSGAATIVAGLGESTQAAYLAGGATILFGLEKSMLFREKWTHHLSTAAQLQALKLEHKYGKLSDDAAAKRIGEIVMSYAIKLPIAQQRPKK